MLIFSHLVAISFHFSIFARLLKNLRYERCLDNMHIKHALRSSSLERGLCGLVESSSRENIQNIENMETKKSNRGGYRPGAGRPAMNRIAVNIRLSKEVLDLLPKNKSDYINKVLKEHFKI